jgi:raffinose/stachyose/melibiose transport system permease protein
LKTPQEMSQSILALPQALSIGNFKKAIELTNFYRSFANSFFITFFAVMLTLMTNSMVAFAIARNMDRKLYRTMYYYFVSALFIPFPVIMLPIVRETAKLGMDNQIGLIFLYVVYGLAFNIFVYVSYIKSISPTLDEAAYIDGAGPWKVFWHVIFPLMKPINATVGILTTIWVWNDFMLPLVILNEREDMTLPIVQFVFQSQFSTDFNLAFSSYLMTMSPLIIVYLISQKWIISNVMRGAIK